MSAGLVVQALISGAAAGAVYALIGMGYSLIYRMSGVLDFAHGELVTLSIFAFLFILGGGSAVGSADEGALIGAGAVALVIAAVAAVTLQRVAVMPFLRRGATVGWVSATAAGGLLLSTLVGLRFQAESYSVPDILPLGRLVNGGIIDIPGGGVVDARSLAVLATALMLAGGFDRWLQASRIGRAMRASAEDADAARLCGVGAQRLQTLAWAIAGGLAMVAGVLLAPARPVTLQLGVILGLKGIVAAVLGGLGSARGAIVAGLCIGVFESALSTLYLPAIGTLHVPQLGPAPALHDVAPLLLFVMLLALVPSRLAPDPEVLD